MPGLAVPAFLPSCPLRPPSQRHWHPQSRRVPHTRNLSARPRLITLSASGGGSSGSGRDPTPVKPAYYKNPSKAIEKGGGFYIPGLRGPRLRFFVSAVTATLLTLNHVASPAASSPSLTASESLAAVTILAVLATAVSDALQEAREERALNDRAASNPTPTPTADTADTADTASAPQVVAPQPQSSPESPQLPRRASTALASTSSWALSVAADLTPMTAAAAFRDGTLCVATAQLNDPDAKTGPPPGDIARRVAEEGRVLYVADTAALPPDVSEPVLGQVQWALLAVPVDDAVVLYVAPVEKGFSIVQRRWLEGLALRVVEMAPNASRTLRA